MRLLLIENFLNVEISFLMQSRIIRTIFRGQALLADKETNSSTLFSSNLKTMYSLHENTER